MFDKIRWASKVRHARKCGFSSYESYEIQTAVAKKEGYEKAQSEKRDRERERVKREAYLDAISTRPKWLRNLDKGIATLNRNMDNFSRAVASDGRKRPSVF